MSRHGIFTGCTNLLDSIGSAGVPLRTEAHDLIMSVFGGMSNGERNRIKIRVRAAMAAQARVEGRYLGGRPLSGYRLADVGPHPDPGKAAVEKRRYAFKPDPDTAPTYRDTFPGLGFLRSRNS